MCSGPLPHSPQFTVSGATESFMGRPISPFPLSTWLRLQIPFYPLCYRSPYCSRRPGTLPRVRSTRSQREARHIIHNCYPSHKYTYLSPALSTPSLLLRPGALFLFGPPDIPPSYKSYPIRHARFYRSSLSARPDPALVPFSSTESPLPRVHCREGC